MESMMSKNCPNGIHKWMNKSREDYPNGAYNQRIKVSGINIYQFEIL